MPTFANTLLRRAALLAAVALPSWLVASAGLHAQDGASTPVKITVITVVGPFEISAAQIFSGPAPSTADRTAAPMRSLKDP